MNLVEATCGSDEWLVRRTRIDEKDLCCNHGRTEAERFPFFRAAYYCWVQFCPQICPNLAMAPPVSAAEFVVQVVRSDWDVWKKA
jgi:hypothetical protein